MNWRPLAGWAGAAILSTLVVGYVWAAAPGFVPVLLFAGFWHAQRMTWESEFEYATRQLLRKAR